MNVYRQQVEAIKIVVLYPARTIVVLPALLAVYCSTVEAAEWKIDSTINQSLSYDDNFQMTEEPVGSLIYQLTPTLNFDRNTDFWDIETDVSYGLQTYSDKTAIDQNPQRYGLITEYRAERSTLGLAANYSITPTRNTATAYSGNFTSNATSENWSVSPNYSFKLSELDSLISSASYSQSTYSTDEFNDNENQSINLGWQRQWSERGHYSISVFYSSFKSTGQTGVNSDSDSYGINLSANYSLSELWQLSGTVGGRMTDSTTETQVFTGQIVTDQNTSEGFLADLSAIYTGEKLSSSFSFSRSLIPSAQGQLTEQTSINLRLSYQLSEQLSANLGGSYQQTDSVNNNDSINNTDNGLNNRTNISLSTGLDWKLAQDWVLSGSYLRRSQETTYTADANLFMLTLNYNWPGFSLSR